MSFERIQVEGMDLHVIQQHVDDYCEEIERLDKKLQEKITEDKGKTDEITKLKDEIKRSVRICNEASRIISKEQKTRISY